MRLPTMLEKALDKIADSILAFDEASLNSLWNKYKERMEVFDTTREWEKSVIIFFIINAVRVKNHIFNEQITLHRDKKIKRSQHPSRTASPHLRRVK
jgi:hypothetical protein